MCESMKGKGYHYPETHHACEQNTKLFVFLMDSFKFYFEGSISRCPGSSANKEGVPQSRLRVHPSPGHRHHCSE